jgi:hypothetical protein
MTAACTGMRSDRNTTSSSSPASAITTAMNTGSLLDRMCEKSTHEAVAPPTNRVAWPARSIGGITSRRNRVTRLDVWALCGGHVG